MKKNLFPIIIRAIPVVFVVAVAFILTSHNIFHYPSYFDDEGIYLSRAWSFYTQGKLSPYTYWYDHAPFGWILIALWMRLTGGFFTFGLSINSGRVFMLILTCLSSAFVYSIAKILTKRVYLGIFAAILFIASPLSITLHRVVFLDNIMVTLLLASWVILLSKKKLVWYAISGLLFGLAILTKEIAPFFFPTYIATLWFYTQKKHRLFPISLWLFFAGAIVSVYPVYALLKGEFFYSGTPIGGIFPHVSLLWTLLWQASRKGGYFLSPASQFMYTLKNSWLATDAFFLILGIIATTINFFTGFRKSNFLLTSLFTLIYILYLIRGGIINDQYLIPLLPALAINIAVFFGGLEKTLSKIPFVTYVRFIPFTLVCIVGIFFYLHRLAPYLIDETTAQKYAINWLGKNLPKNQIAAVDQYALLDLYKGNIPDIYTAIGPQHYWELDSDPKIVNDVLHNDWTTIQYEFVSSKTKQDIQLEPLPKVRQAFENSSVVATFSNPTPNLDAFIPNQEYGHILIADSSPIQIYKLNSRQSISMRTSWDYQSSHFIHSYGQVIDPKTQLTSSDNQAEFMLEAVFENDSSVFDGLWGWTKDHLQYRGDRLLSKDWIKKGNKYSLGNYNASTHADEDIAESLLLAYQKWGNKKYYFSAAPIIQDIWKKEIIQLKEHYYVISGTDANTSQGYIINSADCAPATYRLFALYDIAHPWNQVANDCYFLFANLQVGQEIGKNILITPNTGEITIQDKIQTQDQIDEQTTQTIFHINQDALWWETPQTQAAFAINNFSTTNKFIKNIQEVTTISLKNSAEANTYWTKNLEQMFQFQQGFWGDSQSLTMQFNGYFGTMLSSRQLPSVFETHF